MDNPNSTLADPSDYEDLKDALNDLCSGVSLRIHKLPIKEKIGSVRAQMDWNKLVSPVDNYKGGLSGRYSFVQVAVPECLPDWLEIISYANEFAFLYDDFTDNVNQEQGAEGKKIQAQIFHEMQRIDADRASTSNGDPNSSLEHLSQPKNTTIATSEQAAGNYMQLDDRSKFSKSIRGDMNSQSAVHYGIETRVQQGAPENDAEYWKAEGILKTVDFEQSYPLETLNGGYA